jgi:hypothetical protein
MMLASIMTACQKEQATPASDQIQEATQPAETAAAEEAVVEEKPGIGPDMLLLPTMENMGDKFPGSWDNYGLIGRMMLFSRVFAWMRNSSRQKAIWRRAGRFPMTVCTMNSFSKMELPGMTALNSRPTMLPFPFLPL